MNYSILRYIFFKVLVFTALFLAIPCVVATIYDEPEGIMYAYVCLVTLAIGLVGTIKKPKNSAFYAKEGFVCVALSWITLGAIGALPLTLCGDIPNYIDALFETVSGFTTTGATILTNVESLSHCSLFWRSFTHWIGGMGVLVFILAVTPLAGGYNIHIMKAESPGPSVGKLVPKIKHTALILYGIYFALTVMEFILLLITGMPVFDSIAMSLGTAGTGGFGILNTGCATYSYASQTVLTVFMILFGVNFTFFYLLLLKRIKQAIKMEEVRWYLIIIAIATICITFNIKSSFSSIREALHHSAFTVASIITTTGFSTVDFDMWPALSKTIIVTLMFVGACAGSTGGGLKVSRILTYFKVAKNELGRLLHPKRVNTIQLEGKTIPDNTIRNMLAYLVTFALIFAGSLFIISLDGFDYETNFTSIATTINNIGPGLGSHVGPTGNFSEFSPLSKIVMSFDMLIGRLEVFPMLILFSPSTWRRGR